MENLSHTQDTLILGLIVLFSVLAIIRSINSVASAIKVRKTNRYKKGKN